MSIFLKDRKAEWMIAQLSYPHSPTTTHEFIVSSNHIYRGSFSRTKARSETSLQDYPDLLCIVIRYGCSEARQNSRNRVPTRERRLLAHKYNAEESLMPAYNQLCKGDEAFTRTEAQETGLDRAIMIAAARDNIRISEESRSMVTTGGRSFTSTPAFGAPPSFGSSAPAVASTWPAYHHKNARVDKS
ncbi:hypothetical protein PQX77_011921 [Marasmius sp. AFHP31]|nr:hypothetical protein PQX77_011921 [Marasmius sp. AFHP31]